MIMTYLDGFSGYGGFHLALEQSGFKFDKVYFSEIDKHAIANYSYNFPNSIYAGSITAISKSTIGELDLFTFGWPCQDNSIAGKRKGQSGGTRSGLLYEAVRIISECKPRHFIAENVKGLYSVNSGVDFRNAVEVLAYLNESCPQYDIEMQLCNTRWVLPQNRERLFFIGHLRGTGSKKVFPIGENDKLHNATSAGWKSTRPYICTTIRENFGGKSDGTFVIAKVNKSQDGKVFDTIGISQALSSGHYNSPKILAHYGHKDKEATEHKICPTLKAQSHGHEPMMITNTNMLGQQFENDYACTIRANASHNYQLVNKIRKLTEIECERLQGLHDGWTKYGIYDGEVKEISTTQRYKLCGNGVSVPIVKLITDKLYKLNYETL